MRLGICASRQGLAQLEPLLALGELEAVAVPAQLLLPNRPELIHGAEGHRPLLEQHWPQLELLVGAMAAGALIRLLAPLLQDKELDPAVLLLSGDGQQLIPLLGGHRAGGEQFAQRLAALLGNAVISTGLSSSQGRVPLDSFGEGWGWRRGQGNWDQLMKQAARDEPLALVNEGGQSLALADLAVTQLRAGPGEANPSETTAPADLWISPRQGPGCRWHPPLLWVGVGCERHSSETLMASALDSALGLRGLAPGAVAGLASLSLKGDEPALLALASKNNWPLRLFEAAALAAIPVPNPSAVVAAEVGTASVAEAAALAAAGPGAELLVAKTIRRGAPGEGAVTVAIALAPSPWAPQRGSLELIGAGPGCLAQLTGAARAALGQAQVWVGYSLYLDLLEPLRQPGQARVEGQLTQERQRCQQALALARQGIGVALISSGESGMYGMAGLALEEWLALPEQERPSFTVHPGISAFQMAAARLGAPLMHDLCTVSLSDRLTPWPVIERRLLAASQGDFVVALYNPRSRERHWQLQRAQEILLEGRPGTTPVAICRQLSRPEEQLSLHRLDQLPLEQVDMFSLVLVGNSSTRQVNGRLLTPRGYPGAELQ
jgi:cobalt-precorrin 5A hydrolase/precorrin-3B C17-methyltransferase